MSISTTKENIQIFCSKNKQSAKNIVYIPEKKIPCIAGNATCPEGYKLDKFLCWDKPLYGEVISSYCCVYQGDSEI